MALGGKREGAGRKKGIPNKDKKELFDKIREKYPDYDPILAMVAVAIDEEEAQTLRLTANKEIAQYLYPRLKATEVNHNMTDAMGAFLESLSKK